MTYGDSDTVSNLMDEAPSNLSQASTLQANREGESAEAKKASLLALHV